jgi:hypothetical protein
MFYLSVNNQKLNQWFEDNYAPEKL